MMLNFFPRVYFQGDFFKMPILIDEYHIPMNFDKNECKKF